MLSKQNDRLAIRGIILSSLLTLLSSCANSAAIESLISADPDLKEKTTTEVSNRDKTVKTVNTSTAPSRNPRSTAKAEERELETETEVLEEQAADNLNEANKERVRENEGESDLAFVDDELDSLLLNFPDTFPVYPQAELEKVESSEDETSGTMVWKTDDNRQAVADYYLAELSTNDWDVIKPFTINSQRKVARAIAVKDNLRVELSLQEKPKSKESQRQSTELSVVYNPLDKDIPQSSISRAEEAVIPQESEPDTPLNEDEDEQLERQSDADRSQREDLTAIESAQEENLTSTKLESALNNQSYKSADTDFSDLDEVPTQLQQPIESIAALNILTPYTGKSNVELTKFAPNETITRGEYARWLIDANNRYYADNPGKKIYVPAKTSQPAFKDVQSNHPNFAAIQSLAEAGLIPSRLTEDSTKLLFKPNAPLTREDLVTWKVPLDTRQSLPKASIEAIEESWGFSDAAKINSSAVQALYADFQNGDLANIRRVFGYTTLFQPKKPVTRAEAAASLWYFGFQGDGITAKEVLESEAETQSRSED